MNVRTSHARARARVSSVNTVSYSGLPFVSRLVTCDGVKAGHLMAVAVRPETDENTAKRERVRPCLF